MTNITKEDLLALWTSCGEVLKPNQVRPHLLRPYGMDHFQSSSKASLLGLSKRKERGSWEHMQTHCKHTFWFTSIVLTKFYRQESIPNLAAFLLYTCLTRQGEAMGWAMKLHPKPPDDYFTPTAYRRGPLFHDTAIGVTLSTDREEDHKMTAPQFIVSQLH